jgi:bifunctional UDP-N-acetylglucosamine pyrophosphorylase/glucosamine-1-phosphate N-acetyltransferase
MISAMNTTPHLTVIILAAGNGTRMHASLPKVLHPIAGKPMLDHVIDSVLPLAPANIIVVGSPAHPEVMTHLKTHRPEVQIALQDTPKGTGHAVQAAMTALPKEAENILIVYGDTPCLSTETLSALLVAMPFSLAGFTINAANAYGRILRNAKGDAKAIVEWKHASVAERAEPLCNSGVLAITAELLKALLPKIQPNPESGEYYLVDLVALAVAEKQRVAIIKGSAEEFQGVNTKEELATVEGVWQQRLRRKWLQAGVTMQQPETVHLQCDTLLATDVVLEPSVYFGPKVQVGEGSIIRAFSHIEGATIAAHTTIGPFARLRPGSNIGKGARIGNFVEIKASEIASGAKVSHLSYIGDSNVGEGANIGAGVITCNYDGKAKHRTIIGKGAFIGSNVSLVAPLTIGEDALVGAGSTITEDVPAESLALSRPEQISKKRKQ